MWEKIWQSITGHRLQKKKHGACTLHARYLRLQTYILTPWNRVLPEKLKRPELLKKFPAFYGTRRFITAFTIATCPYPGPD
jgi:hypothetical protein